MVAAAAEAARAHLSRRSLSRRATRTPIRRSSREEFGALADAWYTKLDTGNTGRVSQADFPQRFATLMPAPPPPALGRTGFPVQAPATNLGPDNQVGTWPEFNTMIGGFFKFHWNDGQEIT